MTMQDDPRLAGQEAYLLGVTLIHQLWTLADPRNDHDHCEFCWAKFAAYDGCNHTGYATEDCYRWVCEECFRDFKDRFQWKVK